jgi:hypothetical protein
MTLAALLYFRPCRPGDAEYRAIAYFVRLFVAARLEGKSGEPIIEESAA